MLQKQRCGRRFRHARRFRLTQSYFSGQESDVNLKTVQQVIDLLIKMSKVNPALAKNKLFQMIQHGSKEWRAAASQALSHIDEY